MTTSKIIRLQYRSYHHDITVSIKTKFACSSLGRTALKPQHILESLTQSHTDLHLRTKLECTKIRLKVHMRVAVFKPCKLRFYRIMMHARLIICVKLDYVFQTVHSNLPEQIDLAL